VGRARKEVSISLRKKSERRSARGRLHCLHRGGKGGTASQLGRKRSNSRNCPFGKKREKGGGHTGPEGKKACQMYLSKKVKCRGRTEKELFWGLSEREVRESSNGSGSVEKKRKRGPLLAQGSRNAH